MVELRLKRVLGNGFAIAVLVGGTIGLGILRTPGEIASLVSDPVLYLLSWLGGGIFVLMTLAFLGELIAMAPRSGGCFILVSRAYGPYGEFLIG